MSNSAPLTNPSPKQRFLANASNIHRHREIMDDPVYEHACDLAMIQYAAAITQTISDAASAQAAGYLIKGAIDYHVMLRMLSEVPRLTVPKANDNLITTPA